MPLTLMTQVTVRDLGQSELTAAGAVVGRALQDNPIIQRVFDRCHSRRAAAVGEIYGTILRQTQGKGIILGAFSSDDTLIGVAALVQPGRCAQTTFEKIALTRVIQSCTSVEMALAYQRWQSAWARRDPKDQHWHVGPIAVEPGFQRKGVGTALLTTVCERIDAFPHMAWLETDRRETVSFFTRFAFKETAEAGVLETPNWFLMRSRQR